MPEVVLPRLPPFPQRPCSEVPAALFSWRLHQAFSSDEGMDLLIFESPELWRPCSLVHFESYWEGRAVNPYCPRIPLK